MRVFLNTFYPLYPKVLQALKSFPNVVGVFDSGAGWFGYSWIRVCRSVCTQNSQSQAALAKDVQVDRRGFTHGKQDLLNVLNVQSLLRFPLPTAQHDVIHLLRTDPWPVENPTLSNALNNLWRREGSGVRRMIFTGWLFCFALNEKAVTQSRLSFEFWANETEMKEKKKKFSVWHVCNINRK